MKKFYLVAISSLLAVLVSCGGGSDSGSSSNQELFYNAARQTTPAITATASADSISINAFSPGTVEYSIYNLMRDYNNDTDNGKVDMTNMYKVLYEAGNGYDNAVRGCTPVALLL